MAYMVALLITVDSGAQEEVLPREYTIPSEFQSELLGTWKDPLPRYLGMGVFGLGSAGAMYYSFTNFYTFYNQVKDGNFDKKAHESVYSGVLGVVIAASLSLLFRELLLEPQPPQRFLLE